MKDERVFLMQQAYATLFVTTNKIQAKGDKEFYNITSRQFMLILAVMHLKQEETTFNNIASKLGTSKQNVNTIVSGLMKKGYVKVVKSNKDKRAVNVILSDTLKQELMNYSEIYLKSLNNLFKNFSTDEIDLLWKLLKKLYEFDGVKQEGFEEYAEIF